MFKFYHATTPENAQAIRAGGFRPSADGELGPRVYVIDSPFVLTASQFRGAEVLSVATDSRILQVQGGPNAALNVLRSLYGRERGTQIYDQGGWITESGQPDWTRLQAEVQKAGYGGITDVSSRTLKNTVIFDAGAVKVLVLPPL